MEFVPIPQTELEVASSGSGNNRIIFFRVVGRLEPIDTMDVTRVVLIGNPEKMLKEAMDKRIISRPKLGNYIPDVSGNTYKRFKRNLDDFDLEE